MPVINWNCYTQDQGCTNPRPGHLQDWMLRDGT